MNLDTTLLIFFIVSLSLGLTSLILFSALGSSAESLVDPFEEDND